MNGARPDVIRVVIADDDALIRDVLRDVLDAESDIEVVAAGCNVDEAIELVEQHQPDVAVLDVRMPGGRGTTAALAITRRFPHVRLIALSAYAESPTQESMTAAGVSAYLVKGVPNTHIVSAVRQART